MFFVPLLLSFFGIGLSPKR